MEQNLKDAKMATFNARAETVETKPFFRDAFKRTRCLIPMSGYYEWQDTPGGKQPWYFTARDGSPLLTAAGLWDEWKDRQTGERLKSCTMIVTEPNDFAAEVDRMPVFLKEEQFAPWLSGEAGARILKPAPNDYLQRWPVSKRVNSSKADPDDPALIDRVFCRCLGPRRPHAIRLAARRALERKAWPYGHGNRQVATAKPTAKSPRQPPR